MKHLELDFWNNLIKSRDWKYLNNVWEDHAKYLMSKALAHFRKREFEEGYAQLARYDDTIKRVNLIKMRISELKKEGT